MADRSDGEIGARARYVAFALAATTLTLLSYVFREQPYWGNVLLGSGVALLAVVATELLWALVGGQPMARELSMLRSHVRDMSGLITLLGNARRSGLENFYGRREDVPHDLTRELVFSASDELFLVGQCLERWAIDPDCGEALRRCVTGGCAVRLLVPDPAFAGNRTVSQDRGEDTSHLGTVISSTLQRFDTMRARLRQAVPDLQLDIRTVPRLLRAGILISDHTIVVTDYLYGLHGRHSPVKIIKGVDTPLYRAYRRQAETLWRAATPYSGQGAVPDSDAQL